MENDLLAGQIDGVFTSEEIIRITTIMKKIPNQKNPNQNKDIFNNGFTQNDPIWPIIKKLVVDRINEKCPVKIRKITVGNQLIARYPYNVHSDYNNKGDSGAGIAFLIPLYTTPRTTELSFTVVFNERFTGGNTLTEYIATNPPLPEQNASNIWHLLLDRDNPERAKYLSVKLIGEWKPGSLIYWDRELLHASDDFRLKGIVEKSALVLFASSDD